MWRRGFQGHRPRSNSRALNRRIQSRLNSVNENLYTRRMNMSNAELVKQLRAKTGARINHCVEAIVECGGDLAKAEDWIRIKNMEGGKELDKSDKEGRIGVVTERGDDGDKASIVEISTSTDFAAKNAEVKALLDELGCQAVSGKIGSIKSLEISKLADGRLAGDAVQELAGKTGEKIAIKNVAYVEGKFGCYLHNGDKQAAVVEVDAEDLQAARELGKDLAMHVVFAKPKYLNRDEVPQGDVDKEKAIIQDRLKEDPKNAKKPPEILEKIANGQIGKFYGQVCLLDQPYYRDGKRKVSDVVKEKGASVKSFRFFMVGK